MLRISYELNSALRYRDRNRIFGNIDNQIKELSTTEIVNEELDKVVQSWSGLFDRDNVFFEKLNGKQRIEKST